MNYVEAARLLSDENRHHIEKTLAAFGQHTALCYRARTSLNSESRLLPEAWETVFDALLTINPDEANRIQRALAIAFRKWILKGPPITTFDPKSFGKAITLEYFCRLLVEKGYFGSVKTARRNIRNVLHHTQEVISQRWRHYDLGKYLMWSTFSTGGRQEDPFDGFPDSADGIRGVLGLDPNEKSQPILLMVYSLPPHVVARFPTIAEAYAGDKWNYFFTPAPHDAHYGVTLPWPEYQDRSPRPEVVHEIIQGVCIKAPVLRVP